MRLGVIISCVFLVSCLENKVKNENTLLTDTFNSCEIEQLAVMKLLGDDKFLSDKSTILIGN